ncbi:PTS sugar transporter subunit IIA [Candidatus Laterigemmans baculatus]|uniref:PTS sugar transporter subunit IIA n=1 Tax=Candidatus Laterigemmans baculatus TaxID=2770505 RepID=UPI001F3A8578|nr:PTS sugar transporter subunit IIA [Candidatus Laterigemmans baculatus]
MDTSIVEDFDIGQLAAYLHLTPAQVLKMAERNRLPGRKVGGQWRFPEAEIHHWLEERIGAADEEQLERVEAMLDRSAGAEKTPRLGELLHPEAVAAPLLARTRSSVIREMCQLAANTGLLWDPAAMGEAVQAREAMHPTALDSGVALLHPRRPQTSILADSLIAVGICRSPLPFSDAGQLTDIFFLICSYDDAVHLRILAKLSRVLGSDDVLTGLRAAESPRDAIAILRQADDELYHPSEIEENA